MRSITHQYNTETISIRSASRKQCSMISKSKAILNHGSERVLRRIPILIEMRCVASGALLRSAFVLLRSFWNLTLGSPLYFSSCLDTAMGLRASTKDCKTTFVPLHDSQTNDNRNPIETVREDRSERSSVVPTLAWGRISSELDMYKLFWITYPKWHWKSANHRWCRQLPARDFRTQDASYGDISQW